MRDRRWVTLREAADRTGVPVGTVRSWSKSNDVDTYLELDGESALRMVDLDGVTARARALGRSTDVAERVSSHSPADDGAPGTMIVPIDAWNKMLLQLGNLHEAGQQLAEARERAARAETESLFLREQLKELRERLTTHSEPAQPASAPTAQGPMPTAQDPRPMAQPSAPWRVSLLTQFRRAWRRRRR
jgi:hypothetical protein